MKRMLFDKHQCGLRRVSFMLLIGLLAVSEFAMAETVDFSRPDLSGKQRKLSEFRGKWVVVNYWATWCPPCLAEIPDLVQFYDKHKNKDAVVIGVNFEDIDVSELRQFAESYFMSYPILREKPAPKSDLGLILGLPTSFLISPKGEIVAKQTGPVTGKMIEDFIKRQETSGATVSTSKAQKKTAGKK